MPTKKQRDTCLLIFIFFSLVGPKVFTQKNYTAKDSVFAGVLLEKVQHLTNISLFDSALQTSRQCLAFCGSVNYLRGKAYAHNKIADVSYNLTNLDEMARHDSIAMEMGIALKDSFILATSYNHLGLYFSEKGDKSTADYLFNNAIKMQKGREVSPLTADIYNSIGYMSGLQGELNMAADYYFKSLHLYEELNDDYGQANVLSNLASLFFALKKFDNAITYQQKCLNIRENSNDHYGLAIAYSNMSQMYLTIDSLDLAFSYQQLGMTNALLSGSKRLIAQSHIASSAIYGKKKENEKALQEEIKAIEILENIDDKSMLARRYIAVGIFYINTDSAKAVDYFNKSITLSHPLNIKENLRDAYAYLNIMYRERKDFYNAYYNYRKYIAYRDSILNDGTLTKIAELQTKYETEKKDAQIVQLNNEQLIQRLQLEKQMAIISGNLLEAKGKQAQIDLLIQTKELADLRIKKQAEDLYKQTILAQVSEQKRKLAEQDKQLKEKQLQNQMLTRNIMIAAFIMSVILGWIIFNRYQLKKKLEQKTLLLKERSRISSELHDEVGSTLSTINILSHAARFRLQSDNDKSTELLEKINDNSQRMMDAMSDIVWSINPDNDNLQSMLVRMKEFATEILESKNINYSFSIDEVSLKLKLSPGKRRDVYLIFKEAVNNIAKYAHASEASVTIAKKEDNLSMLIKDNGRGFDLTNHKSGNGLTNMRNRAIQHGGQLQLVSNRGLGTTIGVIIPLT